MSDEPEVIEIADEPVLLDPPEAVEGEKVEAEAGAEEGENEDLPEAKERAKGAKARINELTRLRHEAERERDFYKGLASQSAPNSPQGATVEPDLDDFENYGDYVKALAKYEVGQTQQASATQREYIIREASWEAKVEATASSLPDYATVVGSSEVPISGHVADALMDSDRGPELAYHMATHPEVAERLNRMSPIKAAIELGRLETSLAAPVVKAASKAPSPANTIKTTSSTVPVNLASASMESYIEMRRKQGARY